MSQFPQNQYPPQQYPGQFQQPPQQFQQPPQQWQQPQGGPQSQGAPPNGYQQPPPQAALPQWLVTFQQQVAQGVFPHMNRATLIGQVYPSGQRMPFGYEWKPGRNQGEQGSLHINIKVRNQWQQRDGQMSRPIISEFRVVIKGNRGQQIMNSLGTVQGQGAMICVVGYVKEARWKDQRTGQFKSATQIIMAHEQQGETNFYMLGYGPIVNEKPVQNQYQQGQGQGMPQQNWQQPPPNQQPPQQQWQQNQPPQQQFQQPPQQFQQPPQQQPPQYQQMPQGQPPQQFQQPQGQPPQGQFQHPPQQQYVAPPQGQAPGGTFAPPLQGQPQGAPPQQQFQQPPQGQQGQMPPQGGPQQEDDIPF